MSKYFFKQKTAYEIPVRDWSSDVCSSDLEPETKFTRDATNSRPQYETQSKRHTYQTKVLRTFFSRTHIRDVCRSRSHAGARDSTKDAANE